MGPCLAEGKRERGIATAATQRASGSNNERDVASCGAVVGDGHLGCVLPSSPPYKY